MSRPRVVEVGPASPAAAAGLVPGDEIISVDGEVPTDVIRWQLLIDEPDIELEIVRGGLEMSVVVSKGAGEPLGADVDAAIFDRVQTCDNHCEFCFIYQLPKGMRRSLYLKDDDYRLSFLYGNFTTLTRFTEADLERVVTEGLSPLYVSIHATDPQVRSQMLRNRRGGYSLRWLRALLDNGIEVHAQVVVCPGINDGAVLDDTLLGILEQYRDLATVAVVPLGVSAHNNEPAMRPHTALEAARTIDTVEEWQDRFTDLLGHQLVYCADEYYLLANRPFPPAAHYGEFPMHEDGIGMARAFELEFHGEAQDGIGPRAGFFHWVDGAPAQGYRAQRDDGSSVTISPRPDAPVGVLTGPYGARVLKPLIDELDRDDVRLVEVQNRFFGGNVGVSGLMVGADVAQALEHEPAGHRYLLPDVCLSGGRFLDGTGPEDLPHIVEVIATNGISLRRALTPRGREDRVL